jgi:hypothetical protein
MKHLKTVLIIFTAGFFLLSCMPGISERLEEAETFMAEGNREEGLRIYTYLLNDMLDQSLSVPGPDYGDSSPAAFGMIMESMEKTVPDAEERYDFLYSFLTGYEKTDSYTFKEESGVILEYVLGLNELDETARQEFLDMYITRIPGFQIGSFVDFFTLERVCDSIVSSNAEDELKFRMVLSVTEDLDKNAYFDNPRYLTGSDMENVLDFMAGSFRELVDSHIPFKVLEVDFDGVIKPDPEDDSDTGCYFPHSFPDLEYCRVELWEDYTLGKVLPLELVQLDSASDETYYRIHPMFLFLPGRNRPDTPEDVEQILLIKSMIVKEADYVNDRNEVVGKALMQLIGIYLYDVGEEVIFDYQTFMGGEAAETITNNPAMGDHQMDIGSSPVGDVYPYLTGEETESNLEADLEFFLLLFDAFSGEESGKGQ